MPSLEWNRKWQRMIAEFVPGADEPHFGDRWGDPETFWPLLGARRRFLDPYVRPGQTVLEIGSGGGRITQFLLQAGRIIVVELNPDSFDYLRRRFADHARQVPVLPHDRVRDGRDPGRRASTWSSASTCSSTSSRTGSAEYLDEIERVLRPGGRAVVHYSDMGKRIAAGEPQLLAHDAGAHGGAAGRDAPDGAGPRRRRSCRTATWWRWRSRDAHPAHPLAAPGPLRQRGLPQGDGARGRPPGLSAARHRRGAAGDRGRRAPPAGRRRVHADRLPVPGGAVPRARQQRRDAVSQHPLLRPDRPAGGAVPGRLPARHGGRPRPLPAGPGPRAPPLADDGAGARGLRGHARGRHVAQRRVAAVHQGAAPDAPRLPRDPPLRSGVRPDPAIAPRHGRGLRRRGRSDRDHRRRVSGRPVPLAPAPAPGPAAEAARRIRRAPPDDLADPPDGR